MLKLLPIYCINLPFSKERYSLIKQDKFFSNSQIINGVLGKDVIDFIPNPNELTEGELGCILSHIKVWKMVIEDTSINNNDFVMIIEDDVYSVEDINQKLNICLNTNFDFIQGNSEKQVLTHSSKVSITFKSSACYLIRKKLCKHLLDKIKGKKLILMDLWDIWLEEDTKVAEISLIKFHNTPSTIVRRSLLKQLYTLD